MNIINDYLPIFVPTLRNVEQVHRDVARGRYCDDVFKQLCCTGLIFYFMTSGLQSSLNGRASRTSQRFELFNNSLDANICAADIARTAVLAIDILNLTSCKVAKALGYNRYLSLPVLPVSYYAFISSLYEYNLKPKIHPIEDFFP